MVVLEEIVGSCPGNVENRLEFNLALSAEMRIGEWVLSVLSNDFIEIIVFALCNLTLRPQPNRLNLIDQLPVPHLLRNCLKLGLLLFTSLLLILGRNLDVALLNMDLPLAFSLSVAIGGDLLLDLVRNVQTDRVVDKLGVLLDQVLNSLLLDVLDCIVFQMQSHSGAAF